MVTARRAVPSTMPPAHGPELAVPGGLGLTVQESWALLEQLGEEEEDERVEGAMQVGGLTSAGRP